MKKILASRALIASLTLGQNTRESRGATHLFEHDITDTLLQMLSCTGKDQALLEGNQVIADGILAEMAPLFKEHYETHRKVPGCLLVAQVAPFTVTNEAGETQRYNGTIVALSGHSNGHAAPLRAHLRHYCVDHDYYFLTSASQEGTAKIFTTHPYSNNPASECDEQLRELLFDEFETELHNTFDKLLDFIELKPATVHRLAQLATMGTFSDDPTTIPDAFNISIQDLSYEFESRGPKSPNKLDTAVDKLIKKKAQDLSDFSDIREEVDAEAIRRVRKSLAGMMQNPRIPTHVQLRNCKLYEKLLIKYFPESNPKKDPTLLSASQNCIRKSINTIHAKLPKIWKSLQSTSSSRAINNSELATFWPVISEALPKGLHLSKASPELKRLLVRLHNNACTEKHFLHFIEKLGLWDKLEAMGLGGLSHKLITTYYTSGKKQGELIPPCTSCDHGLGMPNEYDVPSLLTEAGGTGTTLQTHTTPQEDAIPETPKTPPRRRGKAAKKHSPGMTPSPYNHRGRSRSRRSNQENEPPIRMLPLATVEF